MSRSSPFRTAGPNRDEFDPRPRRVFPDGTVEYLAVPERKPIELIGMKRYFSEGTYMRKPKLSDALVKQLHARYTGGEDIKKLSGEVDVNPQTLRTYFQAAGLEYPIKPTKRVDMVEAAAKAVAVKSGHIGPGEVMDKFLDVMLDATAPKPQEPGPAPFDIFGTVEAVQAMVNALSKIENCHVSFRFEYRVEVGNGNAAATETNHE